MTDLERILALWCELESAGSDYVLTTVVGAEGPSYRKPGALMLITADGRRAGTVSGGCLEAEVASRAWWLTRDGPTIERYSTAGDDGDRPYGSGCGGAVILLLERSATAGALLSALDKAFRSRSCMAVATIVEGPRTGVRAIAGVESTYYGERESSQACGPCTRARDSDGGLARRGRSADAGVVRLSACADRVVGVWRGRRCAADGAPGEGMGWFVVLADGRSHLATRERFPLADEATRPSDQGAFGPVRASPRPNSAPRRRGCDEPQFRAGFLGACSASGWWSRLCVISACLGRRRRTRELLAEAAALAGIVQERIPEQVEAWLARLHAPTGLDLGAESPETDGDFNPGGDPESANAGKCAAAARDPCGASASRGRVNSHTNCLTRGGLRRREFALEYVLRRASARSF